MTWPLLQFGFIIKTNQWVLISTMNCSTLPLQPLNHAYEIFDVEYQSDIKHHLSCLANFSMVFLISVDGDAQLVQQDGGGARHACPAVQADQRPGSGSGGGGGRRGPSGSRGGRQRRARCVQLHFFPFCFSMVSIILNLQRGVDTRASRNFRGYPASLNIPFRMATISGGRLRRLA